MPVIEIRSYRLVPGSRDRFHQLVCQQSLPLMLDWGIDVVDFGPSLHDADGYFLIRAFHDLANLEAAQAAFYASPVWRDGPREAIVSLIASDSNVVMEMSQDCIEVLRNRVFACRAKLARHELPRDTSPTPTHYSSAGDGADGAHRPAHRGRPGSTAFRHRP